MTVLTDFLATHQLLTILIVLASGALLGQIKFGPLRFGAAGALFMGLVVGALDPRFGQNLGMIKGLGVVLFCYTVGLAAGSTFLSDLKRQWGLMLAGVVGLAAMAVAGLGLGRLFGLTPAHVAGLYAGVLTSPAIDAASTATHGAADTLVGYALSYPVGVVVGLIMVAIIAKRCWPASKDNTSMAEAGLTAVSTVVDRETSIRQTPGFNDDQVRMSYLLRDGEMRLATPDDDLHVGDQVLVVGNPDDVNRAVEHLGHVSERTLTNERNELDFRRFVVSNPALVGRTLGSIDVRGRTSGKVTRVRRGDLDMLARSDIVLQPGDRVLCVVPAHRLSDAADLFGDSEAHVSQVDALSLGLGAQGVAVRAGNRCWAAGHGHDLGIDSPHGAAAVAIAARDERDSASARAHDLPGLRRAGVRASILVPGGERDGSGGYCRLGCDPSPWWCDRHRSSLVYEAFGPARYGCFCRLRWSARHP